MEHNFKLTTESMPGIATMLNVLGSLIFLCGMFFLDYMHTKGKTQLWNVILSSSYTVFSNTLFIFLQVSLWHYLDRAGNLTNDIC